MAQREISFFITVDDVPFSVHSLPVSNLNELKEGVKAFYPSCGENFELSYFDDEGDKIKITCEPEYSEAVNYALKSGDFLSILVNTKVAEKVPAQPVNNVNVQSTTPSTPRAPTSSVNSNLFDTNPFDQISNFVMNGIANVPIFKQFVENPEQATEQLLQVVSDTVNKFEKAVEQPKAEPAPAVLPKPAHHAICDSCDANISGIRYKCLHCPDYDLCETCEARNENGEIHDAAHIFAKIHRPSQHLPGQLPSGCPYRNRERGFGGRFHRLNNLEQEISELKKQVEQLVEKKNQAQEEPKPVEPVVEEPAPVVIEPIIRAPAPLVAPVVAEQPNNDAALLAELRNMGFTNEAANIRLLAFHNNDLNAVVEALLNL